MFRDNGENLGICSAMTYTLTDQSLIINNWAISCRYFEIGLEEFILQYIINLSAGKPIYFTFQRTGTNQKVLNLLERYPSAFFEIKENILNFVVTNNIYEKLCNNTNLKEKKNE